MRTDPYPERDAQRLPVAGWPRTVASRGRVEGVTDRIEVLQDVLVLDVTVTGATVVVDVYGSPWPARQLKKGEAFLFNYPYTVSPVFLIAFEHEVKPAELVSEDKHLCPQADVPDARDQLHRPAQRRPR